MIRYIAESDIPQGTDLWHDLRSQFVSGTDAYDLLKGKSVQDILQKKQHSTFAGNYYTERGHIYEQEAKEIYSELISPLTNVGFVINDKFSFLGCSPDGIAKDHLVEVKSFLEPRHFKTYQDERLDPHINAQIQYQLFVTEKPYCNLLLYNPDLQDLSKSFLIRTVFPDPEIQQQFINIFRKETA